MKESFQEKKLLFLIRTKKDAEAFALLYDNYVESLYRFIFFKLSDKDAAQDVTSDVFLQMWQYLTTSDRTVSSFRGLLYQTARNKIIDVYRARAKVQTVHLDDVQELPDETQSSEIRVSLDQDIQQLFALTQRLKQDYQEVILFRYVEDLSIKEIADIMDKRPTAVRVMLHRATTRLRALVDDNTSL